MMIEKYILTVSRKTETDNEKANKMFSDLENQYKFIHKIGYRNMPEEMYLNWLVSLKTERSKFENKKLNTFNKN